MTQQCMHLDQIAITQTDTHVCEECIKMGDRWVHLRLCLVCGHVGCCDDSKNKHATRHFQQLGHPLIRSIEPGERWIWCYIVQRTIFYRDLARVDFQIDVDWRELGSAERGVPNLKVAFTARLPECEAWFETPFAAVRRPSDGQEVPALRWADIGGDSYGIALLNDSKYGYDALGGRLRLTLLRSAYEPDSISDIGQHTIRYSLLPHVGNWREAQVVCHAAGFNQPLLARHVPHDRPPVGNCGYQWRPYLSHNSSVQIAGLKPAHDRSGWIVRLYESGGCTVEVELCGLPDGVRAWQVNLIEDRQSQLSVRNGAVRLVFHPWQVQTILVEHRQEAI